MYGIGELIIYGNIGVCRIKDIATPSFCDDGEKKQYYVLEPQEQRGVIYIPVDSDVFMRPLINREEAERLIDLIPSRDGEIFHSARPPELAKHYSDAMQTHDCGDLFEMIKSIYAKKQDRLLNKQKIGVVDEEYMKRAETLLYGELAIALDIPKDEVEAYIASRVDAMEDNDDKDNDDN